MLAAYVLGAAIKWSEDRRENLIASAHARQEKCDVTIAVDDDGMIVATEVHHFDDAGAYPMPGGCAGPLVGMLFTGPYRVPHLGWDEHHDLHQHLWFRVVPRPVDDGDHRARRDDGLHRPPDRARPARLPSPQHPPPFRSAVHLARRHDHRERDPRGDARAGGRRDRATTRSAPSRRRRPPRAATWGSASPSTSNRNRAWPRTPTSPRTSACTPTGASTCSSVPARTARGSRRPPRSSWPRTSASTSTTSPCTRATPRARRSVPAPAGAAAAR